MAFPLVERQSAIDHPTKTFFNAFYVTTDKVCGKPFQRIFAAGPTAAASPRIDPRRARQ